MSNCVSCFPSYGYAPTDIAKRLLDSVDWESGDSITPFKLQTFLFYAQTWSLVLFQKSLFEEDFIAEVGGKVSLHSFENVIDVHDLDYIASKGKKIEEREVLVLVDQVYNYFKDKLNNSMRKEIKISIPWQNAYYEKQVYNRNGCIKKEDIYKFFSAIYEINKQTA